MKIFTLREHKYAIVDKLTLPNKMRFAVALREFAIKKIPNLESLLISLAENEAGDAQQKEASIGRQLQIAAMQYISDHYRTDIDVIAFMVSWAFVPQDGSPDIWNLISDLELTHEEEMSLFEAIDFFSAIIAAASEAAGRMMSQSHSGQHESTRQSTEAQT